MQTEHPKRAAELIIQLMTEIAEVLREYGELSRPLREVTPQPCDQVEVTSSVTDPATDKGNPFLDPWYVDYSPYTMMYIGFVDLPPAASSVTVVTRLRDQLTGRGWRVHEAVLELARPDDEALLIIESPTSGYGARIVGVATPPGRSRIAVTLFHPSGWTAITA